MEGERYRLDRSKVQVDLDQLATLIGLLERAGHARLERGDPRGALQLAEQAITLDQFHEAS